MLAAPDGTCGCNHWDWIRPFIWVSGHQLWCSHIIRAQAVLLQDLSGKHSRKRLVPALPQTTAQPGQPEESSISATPAVAAREVAAELMGAHSPRSSSSTPSRCLVVSRGANSSRCWRGLHQESRRGRESGSWHMTARTCSVVHLRCPWRTAEITGFWRWLASEHDRWDRTS